MEHLIEDSSQPVMQATHNAKTDATIISLVFISYCIGCRTTTTTSLVGAKGFTDSGFGVEPSGAFSLLSKQPQNRADETTIQAAAIINLVVIFVHHSLYFFNVTGCHFKHYA